MLTALTRADERTDVMAASTLLGMFDVVVRGDAELDSAIGTEDALPGVVPRLLALSVLGMAVHGAAVGAIASGLAGAGTSAALLMPAAFVLAFLGALSICLPSFWFYTQLSGLDASFRLVTAQALRGQATTSTLILGALPFYTALALAARLGVVSDPREVLWAGLVLPFGVGLFGIRAIHRGFMKLAQTLPKTHARRGDFLRRMVLAWGAVYTAVAPVALYRLVQAFGLSF
jgi:hypothetical protein